jgi:hypothetical protein
MGAATDQARPVLLTHPSGGSCKPVAARHLLRRIELLKLQIREWVATREIGSSTVVRTKVHIFDNKISF